jgi:hypothetical protein
MTHRFSSAMLAGLVISLAAMPMSGSAQAPTPTSAPAATAEDPSMAELKKRALAYWEARVRRDYRAEYDLLEPRARARYSPDEYGRGRTVQYLAAQVEGAERNGNFGRWYRSLESEVGAPPPWPQ